MKILHLVMSKNFAGIEQHVNELAGYQAKNHDVHVIATEEILKKFNSNLQIHEIKNHGRRSYLQILNLAKKIKKINPDIVHTHGTKTTQIINIVKIILDFKHVSTIHGVKKNKKSYEKSDLVIGVSLKTIKDIKIDSIIIQNWWSPNLDNNYQILLEDIQNENQGPNLRDCPSGYVPVPGNIIYNIGQTSLSGGHGIMRQQGSGSFTDGDDQTKYRWDIDGNIRTQVTLTWDSRSNIESLTESDLNRLTMIGWRGNQWELIPSSIDRFTLDNGQRDNYYDIGKITLKPGQIDPGAIDVTFDWYDHSGTGDFFSVDSYESAEYTSIPSFSGNATTSTHLDI